MANSLLRTARRTKWPFEAKTFASDRKV